MATTDNINEALKQQVKAPDSQTLKETRKLSENNSDLFKNLFDSQLSASINNKLDSLQRRFS